MKMSKPPSFLKPPSQISPSLITSSPPSSSSSSPSSSTSPSPFMVDYLMRSFDFSKDQALKASKRLLHIKNPKKPDSVIAFLRQIGLSESQLCDAILQRPFILTSKIESNLLPKIKLFESIGATGEELADLVASSAVCLGNSTDKRLVPAINFLRQILKDDKKVRIAIKKCPWVLTNDPEKIPSRNVKFLQEKGLDSSSISSLVCKCPIVLLLKLERLSLVFNTVEELGFDPKEANFVDGIHVVTTISKESISRKLKTLSSFGFEKSNILQLFRFRWMFRLNDELMKRKLDFLINKVGFDQRSLVNYSFLIGYSLEGKLIPRYELILDLQARGLVPNDVNFVKIFSLTKVNFFNEYINKFKDEIGLDVIEAYKQCKGGKEELSIEDSVLIEAA